MDSVPQDMGVLLKKISQKQLFLENARYFMRHIMNFRTGSGVRTQVMHRRHSWTVFSASWFGVNACGWLATVSSSQGSNSGNQFGWPSSRTDLFANAASACVLLWKMLVVGFHAWSATTITFSKFQGRGDCIPPMHSCFLELASR